MQRFVAVVVVMATFVHKVAPESAPSKPDSPDDNIPECFVKTSLPATKSRGVIFRDRMPNGSDPSKPCRTVLKSPKGKLLNVTFDLAFFSHQRDFVRIVANNNQWRSNETCAPCVSDVIESNEIAVDFLLTNSSKFMLKYSIIDVVCPPLKIRAPLYTKNAGAIKRDVGSSLQLECLSKRSFKLIGARKVSCEAQPNGLAAWSAPLPTCQKFSNCPRVKKINERAGILSFHHRKNENFHCSWLIEAPELDKNYIEFVPKYRWNNLIPRPGLGKIRGLVFSDGEGRLALDHGSGAHYNTRDSTLKIYFHLSARDLASAGNASFIVRYSISKKHCPAIAAESFPSGNITFSDSNFVGSSARFVCASEYELVGGPEAVCTSAGAWSFQTMPSCAPLRADEHANSTLLTTAPAKTIILPAIESTTEANGLVGTESSIPSGVTVEPHMEEERSEISNVTDGPGTEGERSESSTVSPSSPLGEERERSQEQESLGSSTTVPPTVVSTTTVAWVEPSTPTPAPAATEDSTKPPHLLPVTKQANSTFSEVPAVKWIEANIQRLRNLQMSNVGDRVFLLIFGAIVLATALVLLSCFFVVGYCCRLCRNQRGVTLRENPMYSGTPGRRTLDLSFRMPAGRRRVLPNNNNNLSFVSEGGEAPSEVMQMKVF